jgi:hypothetical protein
MRKNKSPRPRLTLNPETLRHLTGGRSTPQVPPPDVTDSWWQCYPTGSGGTCPTVIGTSIPR